MKNLIIKNHKYKAMKSMSKKPNFHIFLFVCFTFFCFNSLQATAQYGYGGGGGGYYGGGGYGRGGYGGGSQMSDPSFGNKAPKAPTIDSEADNELKWLKKKLKLTDDQTIDVDFIVMDNTIKRFDLKEAAMKAVKENESKRKDLVMKFKDDILKLQADKEAKLKKTLTEEQWVVFEEKKKSMPNYIDASAFQQ
jgi:hypothetical protein